MLACGVLTGFPSGRLAAQQQVTEDSPRHEARCRAAASLLAETAVPRGDAIAALSVLRDCERTAGSVLGRVWQAQPYDPEEILHLKAASRDIVDRRVLVAVIDVSRNELAPVALRVAALEVLGSYISPRLARIAENPSWEPGDHPAMRYTFPSRVHVAQRSGVEPLDLSDTARIQGVIHELADRGPADEPVSSMAEALGRYLTFILEQPRR
jgi:hypothetical protein